MRTFKPTNDNLDKLKKAATLIKEGNAAQAKGKKDTEAGKFGIATWLEAERQVNLTVLEVGELVQIEEVCLIEIGKQSRFDTESFQLEYPDLFAKFTKPCKTIKFKPLVK